MHLYQTIQEVFSHAGVQDDTQKWAFQLALIERLNAHGALSATYCYQQADQRAALAVWLEGEWFTPFEKTERPFCPDQHTGRHLPNSAVDTLLSAAKYSGIEADSLKRERAEMQRFIGKTLSKIILRLKERPEESLLLSRLHQMAHDDINISQIYYHETEADNVTGILTQGFRLDKPLARKRETHLPDGVFVKKHQETLDISHVPVQIPVFLTHNRIRSFNNRRDIADHTRCIPAYQALLDEIERVSDDYDAQCGHLLKLENTAENRAEYDTVLRNWKAALHPLASQARACLVEHFKNNDQVLLQILEDEGSHGRTVETYLALNPEDVHVGPQAKQPLLIRTLDVNGVSWVRGCDRIKQALAEKDPHLTREQWIRVQAEALSLPKELLAGCYDTPERIASLVEHQALQQHAFGHAPSINPTDIEPAVTAEVHINHGTARLSR